MIANPQTPEEWEEFHAFAARTMAAFDDLPRWVRLAAHEYGPAAVQRAIERCGMREHAVAASLKEDLVLRQAAMLAAVASGPRVSFPV